MKLDLREEKRRDNTKGIKDVGKASTAELNRTIDTGSPAEPKARAEIKDRKEKRKPRRSQRMQKLKTLKLKTPLIKVTKRKVTKRKVTKRKRLRSLQNFKKTINFLQMILRVNSRKPRTKQTILVSLNLLF